MNPVTRFLFGVFAMLVMCSPSAAQQNISDIDCLNPTEEAGMERVRASCEKIIADMTDAIRVDPGREIVYFLRGKAFFQLGDYGRALEDASSAIRLSPTIPALYKFRASVYYWDHKLLEGFVDVQRAIELDSTSAEAYVLRARFYMATLPTQGDAGHKYYCTLATKDFLKAIELRPDVMYGAKGLDDLRMYWGCS